MSKKSQLLLVVFISTVQLAVTLIAVAWLFGWFEARTCEFAEKQVHKDNRFICRQIAGRIKEMNLEEISPGSESWKKLQKFVESVTLPDDGFVSVIDSMSGKILCHPRVAQDSHLLGTTWDRFMANPAGRSFLDALSGSPFQKDMDATLKPL